MLKLLIAPLVALSFVANAENCGSVKNHYGPYDYTNTQQRSKFLPIVVAVHFTKDVQTLVRGATGDLGLDLDYLLRTFPNHHAGLNTMMKYQLRMESPITEFNQGQVLTIECYFKRALIIKFNDSVVHSLYGIYLAKVGRLEESMTWYESALHIAPNSDSVHYNMGLLAFEMEDYDKALFHYTRAQELGYPLHGLRYKLENR